ncbi:MAG: hypothetical protein R3F11_14260 [Verrucomicrobiales bacterium]
MKTLLLSAAALLAGACAASAAPPELKLVSTEKIWDAAPHNAFTDLIKWRGEFYCGFREGRGHVSTDGKIRILRSAGGSGWESAAVVSKAGHDLRDAHLCAMPGGKLMLVGGICRRAKDGESAPTGSFVAFSEDGKTWTDPQIVSEFGRWLWAVQWHGDTGYGVAYGGKAPDGKWLPSSLLATKDGIAYEPLAADFLAAGRGTEAVVRFDAKSGRALCLHRRDGNPNSAFLGTADAPYRDWQWIDLGHYFGGPNLIQLPSGDWIGAGRKIESGKAKTCLIGIDPTTGKSTPLLDVPSGGDTSYPGLVIDGETLWMSYYSSHEGKTSIYLAKIGIGAKK